MSDTITITPEERRLLRSGGYGDYERLRLLNALEQAESRAEKAESDKATLEEDLEATEKNLKESSGFIEELLQQNERLSKMVDWLAGRCSEELGFSDSLFKERKATVNEWKEAARRAVAAGEEACQK